MISTHVTLNSGSTFEATTEAIALAAVEIRPTGRASPAVTLALPAFCDQVDAELIVAALRRAMKNAAERQAVHLAARKLGGSTPEGAIALAAQRVADRGGD